MAGNQTPVLSVFEKIRKQLLEFGKNVVGMSQTGAENNVTTVVHTFRR
jgi:hypothetical protein